MILFKNNQRDDFLSAINRTFLTNCLLTLVFQNIYSDTAEIVFIIVIAREDFSQAQVHPSILHKRGPYEPGKKVRYYT